MNAELFGGHSLFFFTLNNGMVNLPVDVVVVLRRRTAVLVDGSGGRQMNTKNTERGPSPRCFECPSGLVRLGPTPRCPRRHSFLGRFYYRTPTLKLHATE
jgi:hypothetical protein